MLSNYTSFYILSFGFLFTCVLWDSLKWICLLYQSPFDLPQCFPHPIPNPNGCCIERLPVAFLFLSLFDVFSISRHHMTLKLKFLTFNQPFFWYKYFWLIDTIARSKSLSPIPRFVYLKHESSRGFIVLLNSMICKGPWKGYHLLLQVPIDRTQIHEPKPHCDSGNSGWSQRVWISLKSPYYADTFFCDYTLGTTCPENWSSLRRWKDWPAYYSWFWHTIQSSFPMVTCIISIYNSFLFWL